MAPTSKESTITDVAAEETLAELIGEKGSQIVNQVLSKEFSSWLDSLWDFVKTRFKAIRGLSNEQVQSLTLNEFIDAAAADILSGKDMELSPEQQSIVEGRLTAMFSADDKLSSKDIESIIETGRVNGFPDGVIKAMLKRRGVKVSVINELMRISVPDMADMPPEFGNVRGGAKLLCLQPQLTLVSKRENIRHLRYGHLRRHRRYVGPGIAASIARVRCKIGHDRSRQHPVKGKNSRQVPPDRREDGCSCRHWRATT